MSKQKTPAHKTPGLTRRSSGLMALEQRFMFDGAAVADAVQTLTTDSDATLAMPVALAQAERQAQQKIEQFLQTATDQQVFDLLSGNKSAPDAAWSERLAELREMLSQDEAPVQVLMMDKASQFNAVAAFAANGPDGKPTIFVNPYWAGLLGNEDMVGVIVEELGHWMDLVLNPGSDTAGDEGQRLADTVMGKETLTTRADADTDSGWVQVDSISYEVEFASFNFVNAYEMVYDLDNDTATGTIDTSDIDVTERWADKEQNLHYFNSSTSLGVVRISDGTNGQNFSGNDVSAISVVVNGTTYYGWISRPIKANGIVRGFYFWTDDRFTTLQLAQADGNQDGDRSVLNNRGFVFVVDQVWFTDQINATKGTSTISINNQKDGNRGSIWVANVGSSSDRVDSALNSVLTPNSAPTAVNDVLSVGEDSGTTSVTAADGLLKNDTDANNDTLTVTAFSVGGVPTVVDFTTGGSYTIANVGTVTINKDGSYSFTPVANYSGPVPPITYTVSDGNGGTSTAVLSITVSPANDPPVSTNDSRTVSPLTTVFLGLSDFGTYSDPESDPLAKIIITSLPSTGSLDFYDVSNSIWVPVTVNQQLTALDINSGKLRVTTATTDMAVGFKVFDGNLASTSAYTLTISVPAAPALPTANTDSGTGAAYVAIEGVDGATGTPASGNVLINDTGNNIRVTAVFNTSVATVGNTTIKGTYGTLTISSNGAYSYAPDNSSAVVDALNVGGSVTETFNYTVTDSNGNTSTSTLTVKIDGANDSPVARDDVDSVKELASLTNGNYGTATGNVLSNDSDVDNNHANLKVVIETSDVIASSGISTSASATSPISSSYFTATQTAGGSLTSRMSAGTSYNFTLVSTGQSVTGSNGLPITVQRSGSGASAQFSFSDTLTILEYPVGTTFEVTGTAGGSDPNIRFETSNFVSVVTSSNNVTLTTTPSQTIQVGYVVTGTNIPANTTVTAINGDVITLSNSVQITNRTLTFTDPNAVTVSANAGEMLKNGTYGYLRIAENGSYTYTLTSNTLNAGQTYTETFTYKATDGSAQSNTATLRIVIDGTSASFTISAVNDSLTVAEDTAGTINVLTDASTGDPNTTAVTGYSWGNQSTTTAGTQLTLSGIGTLSISSFGVLTFTPATNYTGPVPSVAYTASGSTGTEQISAEVSISITPANDPPTGSNDVITMPKNTNAILTLGDFGTFSDPDGDAFSGIKVTTLESAGVLSFYNGSNWVDVTLNQLISAADISSGKLKFTPATNAVGSNYATIGFEVFDGTAYSTSAYMLTVNVIDSAVIAAGNPPVNTVPGAQTISDYQTLAFTGLSVNDLDNDITSSTLTVTNGTLAVTGAGATGTGTANSPLVLTGDKATIDALLATLVYTPAPGFTGSDVLRIQTLDGIGNSDTDFVSITVNADTRALTVTGTTVNEASPYVYFRVAGVANQLVSLDLDVTGAGNGHAIEGADYLQNLEYFNGSTWQAYTGGFVKIPAGNNLLVRTAVLQDAVNEGAETLKLIATNTSGAPSEDNSTIKDDGTGNIFLGDNDFVPDTSGPGFPTYLDDDRPVSVNSIGVNEASPTGVFAVTGSTGQIVRFALIDRTATLENGTAPVATDGTEDYGPSLQIWNGTSWSPYIPGTDYTLTSATTYIRTAIVDDSPFEGQHNFLLGVTRQAAAVTVYGTGSIYDDGTGSYWIDDATAPASNTDLATRNITLDDDRTLTINSPLVNEGSNYVVFTLTGNAGQTVSLQLQDESNNGAVAGKANILENQTLKVWSGLDWVDYDANNLPTFNASGKIFVRVDIVAEQDTPYEGGETFKLNATLSGTSVVVTGEATIIDDGTGVKFPGTFANGSPTTDGTSLDNDNVRPVVGSSAPPPAPAPSPAAPPVLVVPPPLTAPPVQSFASTLTPLAPALVPADPPLSMMDAVTSGSGYQIPVSETAAPGLSLYQGITDQFVQTTGAMTKVSLPFDAFIHSNKDAVIKLEAKQADNSNLPAWVQFDPATGVFEVTPPPGFKGKLDLKVIARDDDGREAVAIFQMFVGEQQQSLPGRDSLTDKLRMAGKRPITLVRVGDAPAKLVPRDVPVREALPARARAA